MGDFIFREKVSRTDNILHRLVNRIPVVLDRFVFHAAFYLFGYELFSSRTLFVVPCRSVC